VAEDCSSTGVTHEQRNSHSTKHRAQRSCRISHRVFRGRDEFNDCDGLLQQRKLAWMDLCGLRGRVAGSRIHHGSPNITQDKLCAVGHSVARGHPRACHTFYAHARPLGPSGAYSTFAREAAEGDRSAWLTRGHLLMHDRRTEMKSCSSRVTAPRLFLGAASPVAPGGLTWTSFYKKLCLALTVGWTAPHSPWLFIWCRLGLL
jgi:hypothetical protein